MEIGSGVDLRRALDAVDVAKLRVNLYDTEKHQLERRFASLSAWLNPQQMPDILCFVPVPQLTKQKAAIKAALRLQELDHDIFYGLPSAESTITQSLASWLTTFHWWSVWSWFTRDQCKSTYELRIYKLPDLRYYSYHNVNIFALLHEKALWTWL